MSREFSLVLLGTGLLTAGYFAAPSPDEELERKAEERAAARTGHTTHSGTHHHRTHLPGFFWVHGLGYAGAGTGGPSRPAATPSVSRGGFGGIGHSVGAGGAS